MARLHAITFLLELVPLALAQSSLNLVRIIQ